MKREFLKELGLTDEQIDKVMGEHGKSLNEYKDKAESVESLETQINDYKGQIKERDNQLKELGEKAKGNEELTTQIDQLKKQNEATKTEYETQLNQQAFDHKLENALNSAKVKNSKALKALLDMDTIKLDGETLKGLDDQVKSLKESDSYLFEQEDTGKPAPKIVTPGNPNGGTDQTKSLDKMTYQELADLKANNPAQFEALTKN